jgi:hypothetical protein
VDRIPCLRARGQPGILNVYELLHTFAVIEASEATTCGLGYAEGDRDVLYR